MKPAVRDRLVMPILLPLGILAVIAAALFGFSRILLSLTPTAATVTAIVVAIGVVVTASVAAGRKQVRLSTIGAMLGVTAGVAMLAGGVALAVVGGTEEEPGGGGEKPVVTLAAANIAFEPTSLTVPAGEAFTLRFHNEDANTQHRSEEHRRNSSHPEIYTLSLHDALPILALAAANIAFEPTSLTVPAGEAFTLRFHNEDANTQH